MVSDQRIAEETLQESKVAALETSGTMSGPLVGAATRTRRRRRVEAMQLVLRGLCMASSVASISLMVTAKESSSVSIYGFQLPLHSKWSFSESYEWASSIFFFSPIVISLYIQLFVLVLLIQILFLFCYCVCFFLFTFLDNVKLMCCFVHEKQAFVLLFVFFVSEKKKTMQNVFLN